MVALRKPLIALLGLSVGSFCLWLSVRGVDWGDAAWIVATADTSYIVLAFVLQGVNLALRSLRWTVILRFRSPVRFGAVFESLLVGYAVNGALPARLGELFRAEYLARRTDLSGTAILASIFVERLLDLLAAVSLLSIGMVSIGGGSASTRDVLAAASVVALVVAGMLTFVATRLARGNAAEFLARAISRLPKGSAVARRLGPRLDDFGRLSQVLATRRFLAAGGLTVPIWAIETCAVWCVCRAVHVDLSLVGAICLMGGASLSTLLPTAPGFVGSYQFAYVLVLAEFGVGATTAVVAATAAQVVLIGSYIVIGFVVLGVATAIAAGQYRRALRNDAERSARPDV